MYPSIDGTGIKRKRWEWCFYVCYFQEYYCGVPLAGRVAGDDGFSGTVVDFLSRAVALTSWWYRSFAEIFFRVSVRVASSCSASAFHSDGGCFPDSPGTCLRVHVLARGKVFTYGFPRAQEGAAALEGLFVRCRGASSPGVE